jgi:hypothetical protein
VRRTRAWIVGAALAAHGATTASAQAVSDTLPLRVAERQIEAFNRRDIDGFMALYADDAVVMEFPSGTVIARGKSAIRDRYARMMQAPAQLPEVRVEPRVVNGAFVFENEVWDAKPGERNQAVWMYEIRGGLIRKAWTVRM